MGYLEAMRQAVKDSSGMHPALCSADWVDSKINGLTMVELLYLLDVMDEERAKR